MIELLCLDVDGTLTDGSLIYGYSLCGNSSLDKHSADLGVFGVSQTASLVSTPKTPKSNESHTENPSVVDSANAESSKNQSCDSTLESRPLRGAKNRIQASSSASADFLLEAEKRGSPPKSEKAAAFWRVGGAGRGVQPFLRKKESESKGQNDEFYVDSQNFDSSLRLKNDGFSADSHESQSPQITEIIKIFNVKDGLALAYWRKVLNRKVAIITGKSSEILRARASELQIPSDLLFMSVRDKGKILRELKERFALDSAQIAAVGDDLNDIAMFGESSLNFAPSDCALTLKSLSNITILNAKGGCGAVREAIELILQKEQIYEKFIQYWQ